MIPWSAMDVGPLLLGMTCAAALVTGFLRNAVGGGIGLALTPVLTLVLPPQPVLAMIGLLLLLSDPISLWLYWRRWDGGEARRLVPAMVVGILLGGWLVAGLSATALRRTIGAAALLFGVVQLAVMLRGGTPTTAPSSPPVALGVGLAAGVTSTVAMAERSVTAQSGESVASTTLFTGQVRPQATITMMRARMPWRRALADTGRSAISLDAADGPGAGRPCLSSAGAGARRRGRWPPASARTPAGAAGR